MILKANAVHIPLKDNSVNSCVTSPPYWSLRKYDIPDLIWDGDEGCEHEWIVGIKKWHSESGTVQRVAEKLGRKAIGMDLGYFDLQRERISGNQTEMI